MATEELHLPDAEELAHIWTEIAEQVQVLLADFSAKQQQADPTDYAPSETELQLLTRPFETLMERISQNPMAVIEAQMGFWQDTMTLWQRTFERAMGQTAAPVIEPAKGDRRFRDEQWSESPLFDFIKQSYLLTAKYIAASIPEVEGASDKRGQQLEFQARQFVDALSPSNFVATNPAVLKETVRTGGKNLVNGLKHILEDLERGKGELRIKMTDFDKFEVGKNVGASKGKVVLETPLMQLIQYEPMTEKVNTRPLLIIPPWINKFYILDLQPTNSFVRWAVENGHTVFVISWVNPGKELAEKSFEDYMTEGSLAAIDAIEAATGQQNVNTVGYCLGGTLQACTLAYLAAKGDDRVKSATFFASLTDFSEPGELGLFIDDDHLKIIDAQMERDGYMDGATMANTFNSLRSNDLIWSFVVNNYLMGKEPMPFDLLYWNSDATRLPRAMHHYYLREMYIDNKLVEPGALTLLNTPIDLGAVKTPVYIVSTKEDHIAPWRATYASTQLYSGPIRFILGGSGHIAGIINPPSANKYGYWTNEQLPPTADEWFEESTAHGGSWWTDWSKWVKKYTGRKVNARVPGDRGLGIIEDTPGRYVLVRDVD